MRSILGNIGVMILPDQIAVARAHEAFDENNSLKDKKQEEQVKKIGANVAKILSKLNG